MSEFGDDPDAVLRGLWGSLVSAASESRSTQNMWSAFNDAAYNYAASVLNVTSATVPTEAEIQAAADAYTGHVTIMDMNRYSSLAGQYLSTKANLQAAQRGEQIAGSMIFDPPWATTSSNPAVPTRYRLRVLRDITVQGFTAINRQEWATYDLGGVLTSSDDALNMANTLFNQADYNARASINSVLDYSVETV